MVPNHLLRNLVEPAVPVAASPATNRSPLAFLYAYTYTHAIMRYTAARRRELRRILATRTVTTQGDLVTLLRQAGYAATQATVSRDLAGIGAVKVRNSQGRFAYSLGEAKAPSDEHRAALAPVLAQFAVSITPTGSLVLVKTPPGAAQMVASAIDLAGLGGVLGTVAGDDTLLVVGEERVGGWRIAKELEQIGAGR